MIDDNKAARAVRAVNVSNRKGIFLCNLEQ